MQKSIQLAIASILVGTIGMASIPSSYASSVASNSHKTTVATGQATLVAQGKKKVKKVKSGKKVKRARTMKKR
jgi:hypothetical protein